RCPNGRVETGPAATSTEPEHQEHSQTPNPRPLARRRLKAAVAVAVVELLARLTGVRGGAISRELRLAAGPGDARVLDPRAASWSARHTKKPEVPQAPTPALQPSPRVAKSSSVEPSQSLSMSSHSSVTPGKRDGS